MFVDLGAEDSFDDVSTDGSDEVRFLSGDYNTNLFIY